MGRHHCLMLCFLKKPRWPCRTYQTVQQTWAKKKFKKKKYFLFQNCIYLLDGKKSAGWLSGVEPKTRMYLQEISCGSKWDLSGRAMGEAAAACEGHSLCLCRTRCSISCQRSPDLWHLQLKWYKTTKSWRGEEGETCTSVRDSFAFPVHVQQRDEGQAKIYTCKLRMSECYILDL